MAWWCIFPTKPAGTVNGEWQREGWPKYTDAKYRSPGPNGQDEIDYQALQADVRKAVEDLAEELVGERPIEMHSLPYGQMPCYNPSGGEFCFGGKECWDRGSCPRRYACSE